MFLRTIHLFERLFAETAKAVLEATESVRQNRFAEATTLLQRPTARLAAAIPSLCASANQSLCSRSSRALHDAARTSGLSGWSMRCVIWIGGGEA
jgi:hypothetical protein